MCPHLKSESVSLLPNFLQEEFHHRRFGWAFPRGWIHLDALDPDVPPEGQPHHVQVIAPVAEGTR